jgi:putative transposase
MHLQPAPGVLFAGCREPGDVRTCCERHGFAVLAYCFMPDHVHLLVEGVHVESNLQRFVRNWKQRTAFWFMREKRGLVAAGYYEHILRSDESVQQKARYVLENPVRAGLVEHPGDYPWVGSFVTTVDDLLTRAQTQSGGW